MFCILKNLGFEKEKEKKFGYFSFNCLANEGVKALFPKKDRCYKRVMASKKKKCKLHQKIKKKIYPCFLKGFL